MISPKMAAALALCATQLGACSGPRVPPVNRSDPASAIRSDEELPEPLALTIHTIYRGTVPAVEVGLRNSTDNPVHVYGHSLYSLVGNRLRIGEHGPDALTRSDPYETETPLPTTIEVPARSSLNVRLVLTGWEASETLRDLWPGRIPANVYGELRIRERRSKLTVEYFGSADLQDVPPVRTPVGG